MIGAVAADRETEARDACAAGDYAKATTIAIETYGREVLQFLVHGLRDEVAASEVFALVAEDTWRGLARFEWRSSLRAWMYAIARNASHQHRKRARRHARAVPLGEGSDVLAVVDRVRTETLTFLRTEKRTALDRLKDELSDDERMLLSLRIDRGLSWPEIAEIQADEDTPHEDGPKRATRLRKRFQLLKDRLKRRGRELGLVAERDAP